jgi:hypothetical protein
MVTTSNAHQKLPRRLGHSNPVLNEGTAPWNDWVRAYEPDLRSLAYSSVLTGVWTYPNGNVNGDPQGADNTVLRGVFPVSGGLIIVGQHSNNGGTSAGGNAIPTVNVPEWGAPDYTGISAIFGLLPFSEDRPEPAFIATLANGNLSLDASLSESTRPIASYEWTFGDGHSSSAVAANHQYTEPGRYLVGLTVTNEDGLSASTHEWIEVVEVAAPAPIIKLKPGLEPGGPRRIVFISDVGKTYHLEQTSSLMDVPWADATTAKAGNGGAMELAVPAPPDDAPAMFYRLVVE